MSLAFDQTEKLEESLNSFDLLGNLGNLFGGSKDEELLKDDSSISDEELSQWESKNFEDIDAHAAQEFMSDIDIPPASHASRKDSFDGLCAEFGLQGNLKMMRLPDMNLQMPPLPQLPPTPSLVDNMLVRRSPPTKKNSSGAKPKNRVPKEGKAKVVKKTVDGLSKPKRQYKKRKSEDIGAKAVPTSPKKKPAQHRDGDYDEDAANKKKLNSMKKAQYQASLTSPTGIKLCLSRAQLVVKGGTADSPTFKQSSSFRGVSCCGKDRKWQARIRDANRVRYLGRYGTEIDAALVYDDAARDLKGDAAPTNFVKMDAATIEIVKEAFEKHGGVPESMINLLVRPKAKVQLPPNNKSPPSRMASTPSSKMKNLSISSKQKFDFPDSPLAKVVGKPPAMSPSKSLSTHKATPSRSLSFGHPAQAGPAKTKIHAAPPAPQKREIQL